MKDNDLVVITEIVGEDFNVVVGLYEWGKLDKFIDDYKNQMNHMNLRVVYNNHVIEMDKDGDGCRIVMNVTDTVNGHDGYYEFLITKVELNQIRKE